MADLVGSVSQGPSGVTVVCRGWHCDRYKRCARWDENVPVVPGWRKVMDSYPAGEFCQHFIEYIKQQ